MPFTKDKKSDISRFSLLKVKGFRYSLEQIILAFTMHKPNVKILKCARGNNDLEIIKVYSILTLD